MYRWSLTALNRFLSLLGGYIPHNLVDLVVLQLVKDAV